MIKINITNFSGLVIDGVTPSSSCEVVASKVIAEYSQAIDLTIVKFCIGIVLCWIIVHQYSPFLREVFIKYKKTHPFIYNFIFKRIEGVSETVGDFMLLFILGIAYYKGQFTYNMKIFLLINFIIVNLLVIRSIYKSYKSGEFDSLIEFFRGIN